MIGDGGFSGFNGEQDDLTGERESGLRLWQAKYKFRQEMLPAFVGEGFGSKVCYLTSCKPDLVDLFHTDRFSQQGKV